MKSNGTPHEEELQRLEENHQLQELKKTYHRIEIPHNAVDKLKKTIQEAKVRKKRKAWLQGGLTVLAAACLGLVILINSSATIAQAMGRIPVLGGLFEAVTFRHYENVTEDYYAKVDIPKIVYYGMEDSETIQEVNKEIKGYVEKLIARFEKDTQEYGNIHQSMEVTYHVILNDPDYFSLRIDVFEAAASGNEQRVYYHIDKATGKVITLKDLFKEDSDYIDAISEEVRRQIKDSIQTSDGVYFFDGENEKALDEFKISETQSFYLTEDHSIVIHFDEYEIAPGAMGMVEFKIPKEITKDFMK